MNTLHLGTIGAAVGSAGMLAASILPGTAANTVKTMDNAEKNQSTISNYVDNQGNSNYAKHNLSNMDQAWNYFNPSNYQSSGDSSSTSGSATASGSSTTGSGVNPGGPINTGTGTNTSTMTGGSGTSSTTGSNTSTGAPGSSSSTGTSSNTNTAGASALLRIPSPLRHVLLGDVTDTLHKIKQHWHSSDANATWTPTGTNWQADWSNWNPVLWEQNGSTYSNWSRQLGSYLTARFPAYASEIKEVGL